MKTANEAATLADEYVLTHRSDRECRTREDARYRGDGSKFRLAGKRWEGGASPSLGRSERATWGQMQLDPNESCHYCKGSGHWKAECPVKARVCAS